MISHHVVLVFGLLGCAPSTRTVFHQSDPTFRPAPGPAPRVYSELNAGDVPKVPMRSVGLVEVTVPESSGIARAIELAMQKGRELGCWILIEQSAFTTLDTRASRIELAHGARIVLAHTGGGGADHGAAPASEGKLTAEFHCVLRATPASDPT